MNLRVVFVGAVLLCTSLALAMPPEQTLSQRPAGSLADKFNTSSAASLEAAAADAAASGKVVTPLTTGAFSIAQRQGGDTCATAFVIPGVPFSDTGTTVGYAHDYDEVCPYNNPGAPDVVYSYAPAADIAVDISLCGNTAYDSKLYVYDACTPPYIACNDDTCSTPSFPNAWVSKVTNVPLLAGHTYYIVVDGYSSYDAGTYTIDVTPAAGPCVVTCPPPYTDEQEPCGSDTNGGCNMATPAFEPLACGQTICGTGWFDGSTRDTDWYEIVLTQSMILHLTAKAEFAALTGFLEQYVPGVPGCANVTGYLNPYALPGPCDLVTVTTQCLGPGTYYAFMAPQFADPVLCPAKYYITLVCEPCATVTGACCNEFTGVCTDGVAEPSCQGTGFRFAANTLCQDLVPPCLPCAACPSGGVAEAEPCGSDTNGGCNMPTPTFEPMYCGETICGTSWYNTVVPGYRDTDWYEIVTTQPMIMTLRGKASFAALAGFLEQYVPGVPGCANVTGYLNPYALPNACEEFVVTTACVPAGTYYAFMAPQFAADVACPAAYYMTLTCTPCYVPLGACCLGSGACIPDQSESQCTGQSGIWQGEGTDCDPNPCPTCTPDFVVNAPVVNATGTTCGAGNNCTLRPSEEIMYEVHIPTAGEWIFSLCGSDFDTYLYVGTTCCGSEVGENDDYCGLQSQLTATIAAGTYYVDIEAYGETTCGNYVLNVYQSVQCDITCPPEGVPEGEPVCYDGYVDMFNGGCNSSPYVFSPITCGETVCATAGTFLYTGLNYRDTDWYRIQIRVPTALTWKVCAEFPVLIFIINAGTENCSDYTILGSNTGGAFVETSLTFNVNPGIYWLWAGTSDFVGTACGSRYIGTVLTDPPACLCGDFDNDGDVDEADFWLFVDAFGACLGNPKYDPDIDLDHDGCITLVDYQAWLVCYHNANGKDFRPPAKKVNPPAPAPTRPRPVGGINQGGTD